MKKRVVEVVDRTFFNSNQGALPRKRVSVVAMPWDIEDELNQLGVVEHKPIKPFNKKGPRPGKLPPDPKPAGKFYKKGEEPEF